MTYRDELTASQARQEALEQQVELLKGENERLRAGHVAGDARRSVLIPKLALVGSAVLVCAGVIGVAAAIGPAALEVAALLSFAVVGAATLVASLLIVVPPGQIVVISGRASALPDGSRVGYQAFTSGRTLRMPFVESANWMDARPQRIELDVAGAHSQGGRPIAVRMTGLVRIATSEPLMRRAVERFLGIEPERLVAAARQTLEGNLREIIASHPSERFLEDPSRLADTLRERSLEDMSGMGLVLDELTVDEASSPT